MAKSFSALKKKKASFEELADKLEKSNSNKNFKNDPRFYYPERDKAGNGFAIIRFLPAPSGEDLAWVKRYSHAWMDRGGWYIEECPTTIEKECPVCKMNSDLVADHDGWDNSPEDVKKLVRKRKRQLQYTANIYVVQDSKNTENEGKVFLFKFGSRIFDKIMGAVKPKFEDETAIDPFDFWEGANFKLKIIRKDEQVNYDESSFEEISKLLPTDQEIEKVWNKEYSLIAFINEDQYKSEEKLSQRLSKVIGKSLTSVTADQMETEESKLPPEGKSEEIENSSTVKEEGDVEVAEDDEDNISYFQKLAAQD